jgi:hypothetical protein
MEHISLDGVIQESADESDFPYGAWTAPYRSPAGREAILAAHGESYVINTCRHDGPLRTGTMGA